MTMKQKPLKLTVAKLKSTAAIIASIKKKEMQAFLIKPNRSSPINPGKNKLKVYAMLFQIYPAMSICQTWAELTKRRR